MPDKFDEACREFWANPPKPVVLARDRQHNYVLLGGLGFMRVGCLWFRDDAHYKEYEGYADAPELVAPEWECEEEGTEGQRHPASRNATQGEGGE